MKVTNLTGRMGEGQKESLGFYGCDRVTSRIVSIQLLSERKSQYRPRKLHIDCPACGIRHHVSPAWRRPTPRDSEPYDVVLRVDGDEGSY